jgi:uncharacterized protein DUF4349
VTGNRIPIAVAALVVAAPLGISACRRAAAPQQSASASIAAEVPRSAPMDKETAEKLRGLGYLQDQAIKAQRAGMVGGAAGGVANAATPPPPVPSLTSRKLIRTAQVALEVPAYDRAAEAAARIAEEHGGYVAESKSARVDARRHGGSLTVRVPSERFGAALAALKRLGTVTNESLSTQDVTKAYTDLETRLRVKRDAAARVEAILNTRTARLSDVLEAERELARLTEEIEQMEGERRFYDQQIALSTITLELQEPSPLLGAGPLQPIQAALHDSLEVLVSSVAGLIYVVVFLAPWLVVAWIVWRVVRRFRRRRAASASAASEPPAA